MKKIITLIFIISAFQANSQLISANLVSSAGGSFYQIYAKMDWAIGETVIETYNANNNYLTQGFIQGANTSLNSIRENQFNGISMKLYPNPFSTMIHIDFIGLSNSQKTSILIFDILGKEIFRKDNLGIENSIDLEHLSAGFYLVNIQINNLNYSTYRIEKLD
jgi:hypothetical protein